MKAVKVLSTLLLGLIISACGASNPTARGPVVPFATNLQAEYRVDIIGSGHGTGAVISKEGHLFTAAHVVNHHRHLGIALDNGGPYPETYLADVVFADEDTDTAVIKINRRFDRTVWMGQPSEVRLRLPIYSVGYTYEFGQFYHSSTIGAIGFNFPEDDGEKAPPSSHNVILSDLPYTHGDSGGMVFSAETGHVIGFAHAIMSLKNGQTYAVIQPIEKILALLDENEVPYNEP